LGRQLAGCQVRGRRRLAHADRVLRRGYLRSRGLVPGPESAAAVGRGTGVAGHGAPATGHLGGEHLCAL